MKLCAWNNSTITAMPVRNLHHKPFDPRFYDWQLAQSPEESWRECHLHARNLLGQNGYLNLLAKVLRDMTPDGWRTGILFNTKQKNDPKEPF